MAVKGYTTETKVEDYILQDIDPSFSARITEWIGAVEQYIDAFTGRNFKADAEASARYFDGDGTPELLIDDCIAITKVEAGEDDYGGAFTEIAATGADRYFLDPLNYAAEGLPIRKVSMRARTFHGGKQNARITARWGYSATPPDAIIFAATVLVGGILNQHRGGGDKITMEKIGNYSVSYDADDENALSDFKQTKEILEKYRKLYI